MRRSRDFRYALWASIALLLCPLVGCTGVRDYFRNGYKVGPNYCPPAAPVEEHWIDATDLRVHQNEQSTCLWWTLFKDATLNRLIATAAAQNLSLKEACYRILQARAQLAIAQGNIFPQEQAASGSFLRRAAVGNSSSDAASNALRFSDRWNLGFSLAWELDLWGRFRRAIDSADAQLGASLADYDDVLVTLLGDVAATYVQIRTDQERIKLLDANVQVQQDVLTFVENRLKAGFRTTDLDVAQARSNLAQTVAAIPQLEIDMRQAVDRLCVLLGLPPQDMQSVLQTAPIPTAPPEVAVGMPADLLRRRPDVRRAERDAAAQAELIGIALADLYPAFTISGNFGYQARNFGDLFSSQAFNGSVGPSFQWNLLNYGRIINNARYQNARFRELVVVYQRTALQAQQEVEDGIVKFLQAQRRWRLLDESVRAAKTARDVAFAQYEKGGVAAGGVSVVGDFNRYAVIQQTLIQQQDLWAQAQGEIAQGLIQVYRALGGGWELQPIPQAVPAGESPLPPEELPPATPVP